MKLTKLFNEFLDSEKSSGIILVFVTLISLILANSYLQTSYLNIWNFNIGGHTFVHWINDGLMALFFLLIGLELEREIYKGELSDIKSASFPIIGAIGGMIIPSLIYISINFATPAQSGAGIPMATDIAFAVGVLSLLGSRVPVSLKIFLTALAVIDDLGAIIVISIFYTNSLNLSNLYIALGIFGFLLLLNRLKIYNLLPYLMGGIVMWYFMLNSGVHATITGVLLAFAVPFSNGDESSPSYKLQHALHKPVAYFILPLFAMANTCIIISDTWQSSFFELSSIGIIMGLLIGKPLGITLFTYLGTKIEFCKLPSDLKWVHIIGTGCLAGIGFTMSIFITLLAFTDLNFINNSKIAILVASLSAGIIGYIILNKTLVAEQE